MYYSVAKCHLSFSFYKKKNLLTPKNFMEILGSREQSRQGAPFHWPTPYPTPPPLFSVPPLSDGPSVLPASPQIIFQTNSTYIWFGGRVSSSPSFSNRLLKNVFRPSCLQYPLWRESSWIWDSPPGCIHVQMWQFPDEMFGDAEEPVAMAPNRSYSPELFDLYSMEMAQVPEKVGMARARQAGRANLERCPALLSLLTVVLISGLQMMGKRKWGYVRNGCLKRAWNLLNMSKWRGWGQFLGLHFLQSSIFDVH